MHKRMKIKDAIFCFAHLRWCHNEWASGIHHSKYWMPIHYDNIEDGQNKQKTKQKKKATQTNKKPTNQQTNKQNKQTKIASFILNKFGIMQGAYDMTWIDIAFGRGVTFFS